MAFLLACLILTTACSNNAVTNTPTTTTTIVKTRQTPTPDVEPVNVPPTSTSTSAWAETVEIKQLEYTIVYEEEGFRIREAFLKSFKDWSWEDFSMPRSRIDLACDHILGGHCLLKRDGWLIWEGDMNGGTCRPIDSSRKMGDDILIDYVTVVTSGQLMVDSILLTRGDTVIDVVETTGYDAAFAPDEIMGKLLYFAGKHRPDEKILLVFDGREVGEYDAVFNQYCCWDGPPIQIYSNGEIVDFFVQKDGDWYHIQAGRLIP